MSNNITKLLLQKSIHFIENKLEKNDYNIKPRSIENKK